MTYLLNDLLDLKNSSLSFSPVTHRTGSKQTQCIFTDALYARYAAMTSHMHALLYPFALVYPKLKCYLIGRPTWPLCEISWTLVSSTLKPIQ